MMSSGDITMFLVIMILAEDKDVGVRRADEYKGVGITGGNIQ
jgi:hypothetical protein